MDPNELMEELRSGGALPMGPCSAWPAERHEKLMEIANANSTARVLPGIPVKPKKVNISAGKMLGNLGKSVRQGLRHGRATQEVRDERMNTCLACPAFIHESKRCSDCGCFMEAKTWLGGDPDMLCPQKKWSR